MHVLSAVIFQGFKIARTEKVNCVSLRLYLQYCQSCQFSHFVSKMKDFVVKTKDFVVKMKDFFLFIFVFTKNPSSLPMFTLHTNEGGACTEHV